KAEVYIAAGIDIPPRSPFFLHEFAGANVFMVKMLKNNIEELNLAATPEQFDEAISATNIMLLDQSIDISLELIDRTQDMVYFDLKISNLAGHKFPSGYPSRRAFVEFLVKNEIGDTIFISGKTDENFEVIGHNPDFEPHYTVISTEDEVQIYEMVMADVNDEVTT